MPDSPPPSLLITPDLRRQLQRQYELAQRLAAASAPDFRRAHDLLADCVRADPGNILYLDALLANLRRWRPKRSWWAKWLPRWRAVGDTTSAAGNSVPGTPYSVLSTQYATLQSAPAKLQLRFDDPAVLISLATAAGDCDFDEVELCYWELAAAVVPASPAALRGLARALTRQGRFEAAAAAWQNVLGAMPGDAEAAAALADLAVGDECRFAEQERQLMDAQAAGGPLLTILGQREELQLARARQRVEVARRRAAADPHPRAARLVGQLQAEYDRLQIEILHVRCERLPCDGQVRLELARCLKRSRNYSGAIQRLDEALRIQPGEPAVLLELGECWQHLRQFAKALEYYVQAALVTTDERKLALYRAGVLEAALGRSSQARQHFEQLVALAPGFLDTRERLDKLPGS